MSTFKHIKCIFRGSYIQPHCDKPAEYIYLGKSYCKEHMELRGKEFRTNPDLDAN